MFNFASEASYVYIQISINFIDKDNDGWTIFMFTCEFGQQDVVKDFIWMPNDAQNSSWDNF